MVSTSLQNVEMDSFKMANSLLKDPIGSLNNESFDDVLDKQIKEVAQKSKDKVVDVVDNDKVKKKKDKAFEGGLPDITKLTQNSDTRNSREVKNTYLLLDKFKDKKDYDDESSSKDMRRLVMDNANNIPGQALIQPVYDQGQRRRLTKSDVLAQWDKYTPLVTEDITKRAVRIDIPLLNDIQALVLRMNSDRSITASMLGSKEMGELIKQNKDKLDKNLKHHHLSLREFNTYGTELELNSESGTKKRKRQAKELERQTDLM